MEFYEWIKKTFSGTEKVESEEEKEEVFTAGYCYLVHPKGEKE